MEVDMDVIIDVDMDIDMNKEMGQAWTLAHGHGYSSFLCEER
jgi:hypothetical protein